MDIRPNDLGRLTLGPCLALSLVLGTACRSQEAKDDKPEPIPAVAERALGPWTRAFEKQAVLIAERIRIEGPEDLLAHIVVRQEDELFAYETKTTPEGLLQTYRLKPEVAGQAVDIRGQLDGWTLSAQRELVILQRPGDAPVQVRADGSAKWLPTDGSTERSGPSLSFRGERGM